MSKNLHKLQVEIVANMKKFKKTCEAVRAEAKKTTSDANKTLSQIGNSKTGQGISNQYKQIQKETKTICDKIKSFSKNAQIDAGILVPTKEYKDLEKNIVSAEKRLDSLTDKQSSMSDKDSKFMTKGYAACSEQLRDVEKRIDTMIQKQQEWASIGGNVTSSRAFQQLEEDIESARKEMEQYQAKMDSMEKSGTAFERTDKWKKLQREITEAREELKRYRDEEAKMAASGTDYDSTIKPKKKPKQQSPNVQFAKAYATAGKKALGGVITEAAKVHPALEKAIRLAEKFGNTARKAGTTANKGVKFATAPMKSAVGFLKNLTTGFGKVYQKIRQIIPASNKFRASTNSMANSCGKLMGRMGALRITATYMLASFMILGGINAMKEGFKSLSQYSAETNADLSMLMSSLTQLRNSLATAFAPILSVVAPILNTFISWLSTAMTAIAHFMAALTGKSQVVVSKKVNQDFAGSIADTGSAADGAADSVDKYKRSLMGFDRINKLDSPDTSTGSSGSGTSGVSASDMFETVEVGSTFTNWAEQFKEAWESADFTAIGSIVGDKLNGALENISWSKIKVTSGNIAKSIATFLNGFIGTTDWILVGKTFAEGVNTVIEFGYEFVTTFDWKSFGKAIVDAIGGLFLNIDWAKVGKTLSEGVKGILDTVLSAISEVDWGKATNNLIRKLTELFTNIDFAGIASKLFELIGASLGAIGSVVGTAISNGLSGIGNYFADKTAELGGDVVAGILVGIWDALVGIGSWIRTNIFTPIINGFRSAFGINSPSTVMAEQGRYIMEGLLLGIREKLTSITNWFEELPKKIKNAIGNLNISTVVDVGVSLFKKGWSELSSFVGTSVSVSIKLLKSGWSGIKKWLGIDKSLGIKFTLPKIKVNWGKKTVAGFTIKYPKGFSTYAKGGFPEEGPFMMNRGEIAGKFSNGKGVVANNQQITTGIANAVGPAVYKAVVSAMAMSSDNNGNITVVLEGDAKGLFKAVKKEAQNYTNATGQAAFPM